MPSPSAKPRIYHVASREILRKLRDDVLRVNGFDVVSTVSLTEAAHEVAAGAFDLVLIDVDRESRTSDALWLCEEIKKAIPDQKIAYACNYRVSINSDCPDEIIHAEFNPQALVESVKHTLGENHR